MAPPIPRGLVRRLGIAHPLLQAPMAGVSDATLAIAVARAGGLGAIAAATLSADALRDEVARFRSAIDAPLNLNFFAHRDVAPTPAQMERWRVALAPLHARFGIEPSRDTGAARRPFDDEAARMVEALRPHVVSFHFGLPDAALLERVKASGALVLSSATTVAEARWLAGHGADAVIAQGWEAGGHRAMFLDDDIDGQVGTFALVPQIVDAIDLPVIAAGGIADGRGMAAARLLGADAVQVGTAFLRSAEATTSPAHRAALQHADDTSTRLTNLFTGRPARGLRNRLIKELGPMSSQVPPFPYASGPLAALREHSLRGGDGDHVAMWAGQAAALARAERAGDIVMRLVSESEALLSR